MGSSGSSYLAGYRHVQRCVEGFGHGRRDRHSTTGHAQHHRVRPRHRTHPDTQLGASLEAVGEQRTITVIQPHDCPPVASLRAYPTDPDPKPSTALGSIRVGLGITGGVWEAAFWGFVGGFALLVGAGLGLIWRTPPRVVGIVMAFGAGVLISAVAFELVEEAFDASSALPVLVGLVSGALTFNVGDLILTRR